MDSRDETIYAFATPSGQSGVAVLRLSGRAVPAAIERLTGKPPPAPRLASLRRLIDPEGQEIDRGLVIYFQSPHSWTGEDVAEFHLHGGRAVRAAMLQACAALGLRLAEAGEFSKRAFLNGKADLAELEGLADLVAAETAAQRRQALRQMTGAASAIYENLRAALLSIQAELAAALDFPEDIAPPRSLLRKIKEKMGALRAEIAVHLSDNRSGERIREGMHVALIGGANVGKSTLLNLLAGRAAAIVSPHAGTTRDVIEVALDIAGYAVIVSDLAGLRASDDPIEMEGVRRAEACAEAADMRIILLAADIRPEHNGRALSHRQAGDIVIVNKIDKFDEKICADADLHLSLINAARYGEKLIKSLTARLEILCGAGESPLITRARHRAALSECAQALARAAEASEIELIAEDLRLALAALGRITGRTGLEDMLDKLFSEFCIGK